MQAVWFSACADLAVDAKRDLVDIGAFVYDPIRIHDLRHVGKLQAEQKLEDAKARLSLSPGCTALTVHRVFAGSLSGCGRALFNTLLGRTCCRTINQSSTTGGE